MPRRDAQIVVLAEDKQQRAFVSRLLRGLGYHPRRVRLLAPPADKSGGATFVLQTYPHEVREHRRKATFQKSLRLLVVIDADQGDVDKRLNELDARLEADDQPKRAHDEGIAILVPDRNIETWIRWLRGQPVDDATEYPKHKGREKQCADAVKRLLELIHGGRDFLQGSPPSLIAAIHELDRLK
jgi:hypothetical protein